MLVSMLGFHRPAQSYRPFEGTDAAVVERGAFELEVGASTSRAGLARSRSAPAIVANIGVAGGNEIVIEGQWLRSSAPGERPQDRVGDTALSLKHLWRRGVLQDAGGLSLATECGLLLPEPHGEAGTGWSCAGIASGRLEPLTLHLNVTASRTRDDNQGRSLGLIAEGPAIRAVRPVAEVLIDRAPDGHLERSFLIGAIYTRSDSLSFDAGLRSGRSRDGHIAEIRAGFTWSLAP